MRFIFIDCVDEFVPNERLKGRYVIPRSLVYPCGRPDRAGPAPSLLLEVLAQAGGWLIKVSREFRVLAIMSVIKRFRLHRPIPHAGTLHIAVLSMGGSERLLGITGSLTLPDGELVASVDSILYVLIPAEEAAYRWGQDAWAVLRRKRELRIVKDKP